MRDMQAGSLNMDKMTKDIKLPRTLVAVLKL